MKLSDIFKFKLFEGGDKANLKIVNENFEIAEKELAATNKEITAKVTEINDRITELNNLLGGKLDVSKIANNLVTTEEGYVLDARMGKKLWDRKIDTETLILAAELTNTDKVFNTYNNRKISDYFYIIIVLGTSATNHRKTEIFPVVAFDINKTIDLTVIHGANGEQKCSIHIEVISDTSIKASIGGSNAINCLNVYGINFK